MMSPDGKWVWDGQKWIPVAVHESVFHQYGDAVAAAQTETPLAETMVSPPVNPFAPTTPAGAPASPFAAPPSGFSPPPPVYTPPPRSSRPAQVVSPIIAPPVTYRSPAYQAPPWERWAQNDGSRSATLKMAGAGIAVVLGVIVIIYAGLNWLPFLRADNSTPTNTAPLVTPTPPLTARSDSAVAGRYVTSVITPALDKVGQPVVNYRQACGGQLSLDCQQALTVLQGALKDGLARLSQSPPACIAPQAAKFQSDFVTAQVGATLALKGYTDNNRTELVQGLTKLDLAVGTFYGDGQAVTKAQAACDDQPQGP